MQSIVMVLSMENAVETRLEMDYPETLLRIWRMTDPDAVRYALSFVRVDFGNRYVEATNGRILVREAIKLDEPFWGLDSVLMYGADLRRITRMFDDAGKRFKLKLVNVGKEWFAENADTRVRINTPDEDARFPNTNDIFAIKPARVAKFNVDMKELRRFIAAFGSMESGGHTGVEISIPLDGEGTAALSCGCRSVNGRLSLMAESHESKRVTIEPEFESP